MKYAKTEAGHHALKERSPLLTARQRSALILCDGKKNLNEVHAATVALGVTAADIEHLIAQGFIEAVTGFDFMSTQPLDSVLTPLPSLSALAPLSVGSHSSPAERYALAYPKAVQLVGGLGLRGFRLTLAVEAASGYSDLVALLPKLTEAVGPDKVREMRDVLGV